MPALPLQCTEVLQAFLLCWQTLSWCCAVLQTVQRRSLRSIMPDAGKVFENFFKTLDIQEPAFKNMVVLYRRKVPDNPQRKSEYEPIRKHNVVSTQLHLAFHASHSPCQHLALTCGW